MTAATSSGGSTADWIGEVPAHWQVKRLKLAVRLVADGGGRLDSEGEDVAIDDEAASSSPLRYVGMEQIESGTGRLLSSGNRGSVIASAHGFRAGDVLFGKLRPYLAKACIPGFDGVCSTELLVLEGVELEGRALLYTLLADGFIKLVDGSTYGSKMPRASWDFIGNCLVPVPPRAEQRAIADFLDRETRTIDALIDKKETLIARLHEQRAAVIARVVGDAHWPRRRLRHISDSISVGVVVNPSAYVADDGVPFLVGGDVRELRIDTTTCHRCLPETSDGPLRSSRLRAGDVVVVRVGYPGVAAVVPPELEGANCASMMIVRAHPRFCSQWLAYSFNSPVGRDQIELVQYGAAQRQFNIGHALDFAFPFPPLAEQQAIAARLDRETAALAVKVATIEAAIARLREYRAALITAAVTGKIDASSSQPSL